MNLRVSIVFRVLIASVGLLLPLMTVPAVGAPAFNLFFHFATNTSFLPEFPSSEPTVSYWTAVVPNGPPWIVVATVSGGPLGQGRLMRHRADDSFREDVVVFTNSTLLGSEPQGPLVEPGISLPGIGTGLMFGTCRRGGAANFGGVFRVRNDGGFYQILRSFAADGRDGRFPNGGLTYVPADGFLYGTTPEGGTNNAGTLFRIKPDGTEYSVLRHFTGSVLDGRSPNGSLALVGSFLFGTTSLGGVDDLGTVFRYQPSTTAYSIRWHFGSDPSLGTLPSGGLISVAGALYGLASHGGTNEAGTLYRYIEIGQSYQAFSASKHFGATPEDARHPWGRLVAFPPQFPGQIFDTRLVGVSAQGGEFNKGTVFAIGSNPEVLHSFGGGEEDGELPLSSVTICEGVALGVTARGGRNDAGIMFRVGLGYNVTPAWTRSSIAGSTASFQLQGEQRVRYAVQSSPDGTLTNWTRLATILADNLGGATYTTSITNTPGDKGRLFRFVWP